MEMSNHMEKHRPYTSPGTLIPSLSNYGPTANPCPQPSLHDFHANPIQNFICTALQCVSSTDKHNSINTPKIIINSLIKSHI